MFVSGAAEHACFLRHAGERRRTCPATPEQSDVQTSRLTRKRAKAMGIPLTEHADFRGFLHEILDDGPGPSTDAPNTPTASTVRADMTQPAVGRAIDVRG